MCEVASRSPSRAAQMRSKSSVVEIVHACTPPPGDGSRRISAEAGTIGSVEADHRLDDLAAGDHRAARHEQRRVDPEIGGGDIARARRSNSRTSVARPLNVAKYQEMPNRFRQWLSSAKHSDSACSERARSAASNALTHRSAMSSFVSSTAGAGLSSIVARLQNLVGGPSNNRRRRSTTAPATSGAALRACRPASSLRGVRPPCRAPCRDASAAAAPRS